MKNEKCPHCTWMNPAPAVLCTGCGADLVATGSVEGIEWPDEEGEWTRYGEQWTARRTTDGEMWIVPPNPEDGCVPRMLAALANPPVLWGWFKSPNAVP